jgi:N-acetylmuramoyl-L-alanine amidase
MLGNVRKAAFFATYLALATALVFLARPGDAARWPGAHDQRQRSVQPASPPSAARQQETAPQKPPQQQQPAKQPAQQPAPATQPAGRTLATVVLDPAQGGTDVGAHGKNGILEKNVTLALAQIVRTRLLLDGLNVVMTRNSDKTMSFAERAAIANAQPNAIFISLDVGSSGQVGSAYAYYYDFGHVAFAAPPVAGGMLSWDLAQRPWEKYSRRLAQLLQVEFAVHFKESPELPIGAPVYQLKAINEPAVAIEIENVNAASQATLTTLGVPLATSISRAVQSFRAVFQAEVH